MSFWKAILNIAMQMQITLQNKQFEQYLNDLQSTIMEDEYCYTHELYEKTTLKDLLSEEDYKKFIKKNAKQGTPIRPKLECLY